MQTGIVKFFNKEKGFGFIVSDSSGSLPTDVFVHVTGLADGVSNLNKGESVKFNTFNGKKGIQAKDVEVVK